MRSKNGLYISTTQRSVTQLCPNDGDAVDLNSTTDQEYQDLRNIAKGGSCGSACVEPEPSNYHAHIDYRSIAPINPSACPTLW